MPSNNKCAYKGCNHTKNNQEDYTFHRFPKDPKLQLDWILLSGNEHFVNLTPKQVYEKRLCSAHFLSTDFQQSSTTKKKLLDNVMPIAYEERIDFSPSENTESINNENFNIANIGDISKKSADAKEQCDVVITTTTDDLNVDNNYTENTSKKFGQIEPLKKLLNGQRKRDPPKHILLSKILKLRAKVKAQDSKIRRLQIATKKMKRKLDPDSIVHYAAKYLNDDQLLFLQMQLNHWKKHPWTEYEKDFALSLYFTSPKAYSLLKDEKHFALPCITLIRQWASNLNC